jgi:hypothetical protein
MGIRIHKALGYAGYHPDPDGLSDKIWDDEQENEVLALIDAEYQRISEQEKNSRLLWMDTTIGFSNWNKTPPKYFKDILHYADHPDQDGAPFLIVPPSYHKKWYRYDDMIDYMDVYSVDSNDPCVTKHKWFDTPLYPYLEWMNKNTGEFEKNYNRIIDGPNPEIVPAMPDSVKVIAKHLGFNWLELRPLLATWWC